MKNANRLFVTCALAKPRGRGAPSRSHPCYPQTAAYYPLYCPGLLFIDKETGARVATIIQLLEGLQA